QRVFHGKKPYPVFSDGSTGTAGGLTGTASFFFGPRRRVGALTILRLCAMMKVPINPERLVNIISQTASSVSRAAVIEPAVQTSSSLYSDLLSTSSGDLNSPGISCCTLGRT